MIVVALILVLFIISVYFIDITCNYMSVVTGGQDSYHEYPLKRLFMTEKEIKERFARLKSFTLDIKKQPFRIANLRGVPATRLLYNGENQLIELKQKNYDDYDNISDYFQEHVRIKCRRVDQTQTPLEYWQSHERSRTALPTDASALSKLRDQLYNEHYECTTFKPSLLVGFGKKFKATSILDISAGWGDRLIGALALGVPYVGVDPNEELHAGYEEIIRTFAGHSEAYVVLDDTFQNAELPKRDYDLVFSSPPYFNLEKYALSASSEVQAKQSDYNVSSAQQWLDEFLFPSLKKAWSVLTSDGHMIININEFKDGQPFIRAMLDFVNSFPDSAYLGCIAQHTKDRSDRPIRPGLPNAQPFWIWQKRTNIPTRETYNPTLVVEKIANHGDLLVVRDDLLMGGSKQRGAIPMFEHIQKAGRLNEVIYVSPTTGFAQIALSLASKITGLSSTVYMAKERPMKPQTIRALTLGGNIIEGRPKQRMRELRQTAEEYIAKDPTRRQEFYLGFDDETFTECMKNNIIEATKSSLLEDRDSVSVIWVAGGSAVLAKILSQVFPRAHLHVVQVGKELADHIDPQRMTLHIAPEFFYDDAKDPPPYPSVSTYDAKVWQFVKKHKPAERSPGKTIIWNVAGDIENTKK